MDRLQQATLTNEEERVSAYTRRDKPTDPRLVTHDTPLDTLNLNWREADLPEAVRTKHVHRLHPYLGKFIPQLVEMLLCRYSDMVRQRLICFGGFQGTSLNRLMHRGDSLAT